MNSRQSSPRSWLREATVYLLPAVLCLFPGIVGCGSDRASFTPESEAKPDDGGSGDKGTKDDQADEDDSSRDEEEDAEAASSSGSDQCGNGEVDADEACDDGAENDDELLGSCNSHCQRNVCESGKTRACRGLLGDCAAGVETCEGGAWSTCSIEPLDADSCEPGNDANCNGEANEDCECAEGAERSCAAAGQLGNCATGTQLCGADGKYGACSVEKQSADACDVALDDADCDGVPNGGCPCTSGEDGDQPRECGPASSVGQCEKGTSRCVGGTWSSCEGAVLEAARDCRSAEDLDCDGSPDNSLDDTCECTEGSTRECDAHPGLDGQGACQSGQQTCNVSADGSSSTWSACEGSIAPEPADSCAAVDDGNCNGVPNDSCECLAGATSTCADVYQAMGDCAERPLTCGAAGTWPRAAQCGPGAGEDCGAIVECTPGVFDAMGVVFDGACFQ